MVIAIPTMDDSVFSHFGKTKSFTLIEVEKQKLVSKKVIDTSQSGHGDLITILIEEGVNSLICDGIGEGAINLITSNNIELYKGITGNVNDVVDRYINGTLKSVEEYKCNHEHNHEHEHKEGHHHCNCGKH